MLNFTRWKAAAIVLTASFICLFAVPNFLPDKDGTSWPKWAQRHVVLGLDLQGGSHILLEVDTRRCARTCWKRCATTCAASCARRGSATPAGGARQQLEVRIREGADPLRP